MPFVVEQDITLDPDDVRLSGVTGIVLELDDLTNLAENFFFGRGS